MTINRTISPALIVPESINILKAEERILGNGLRIYVIDNGDAEVVKFEIIFPTGALDAESFTMNMACHQLADTGSSKLDAKEIAEKFDFYGSFFQAEYGPDFKSFSIYALNHHFDSTLKILNEILTDAVFPNHETEIWIQRNIQALLVNREKVSWLAKSEFNKILFGNVHPYGCTPDEELLSSVNSESLRKIHKNSYALHQPLLIVSGKITNEIIESIHQQLNYLQSGNSEFRKSFSFPESPSTPKKVKVPKNDSIQCGIRIGKVLFSKNHPDFLPLLITNTILGGYFGSRLMSNIREDKGYTYGIGSGLHSYADSGSFFIATEVGKDVLNLAVDEIYKELQQLIDEPVPEDELELVKNYLLGSFQRSLDGPFALADRFKSLKLHGLKYDYFNNYLQLLNKITPEEIMDQASKHLRPEHMTEVIAG